MTDKLSLITSIKNRNSFTLIELLVVLALVAILSVVVILTLNPAELIKQARDSNRLSDLATINTALNLFSTDVTGGFMGTSTVVYVSIPSTTSTCSNLGLPTLPSGYTYNCVTATSTRNTDGTGWIPVNFQRISSNSPISQLPIDPINTTSTRLYYTYVSGGSWELNATVEAVKNKLGGSNDLVSKDGGGSISQYEMGNNLNLNPIETGDSSLVGYWNFEEGSGTISADVSGNGNNGTTTVPLRIQGKVGNALNFLSNSNYVMVADPANGSLDFISDFTMSFWYKATSTSDLYWFLRKNTPSAQCSGVTFVGYDVWISIGGRLQVNLCDSSLRSVAPSVLDSRIIDGNWHNVVAERVGNITLLYFDGSLLSQGTTTVVGDLSNTSALYFGGSAFVGSLDEIRFYNRALSAGEVLSLYNATK